MARKHEARREREVFVRFEIAETVADPVKVGIKARGVIFWRVVDRWQLTRLSPCARAPVNIGREKTLTNRGTLRLDTYTVVIASGSWGPQNRRMSKRTYTRGLRAKPSSGAHGWRSPDDPYVRALNANVDRERK